MTNIKVGDMVEILNIKCFNKTYVNVGDRAEVVSMCANGHTLLLSSDNWEHTQITYITEQGVQFRLVEETMKESAFIERDGKYNLEVTGEQLAWLRLITGKSCDSKGLLSTIERMLQYKTNILPDRTGILTENAIGFDAGKQSGINSWLDQFFTKPLSSEDKRIQELQDTINKAQEEIKKAQEQIKGLKKVC